MIKRLIEKLRAIPVLGVIKVVKYTASGVVKRTYLPRCVLVNYPAGSRQVFAITQSVWLSALNRAVQYQLTRGNRELGVVVKRSYETQSGGRPTTSEAYVVKVQDGNEKVTLAFLPSEVQNVVDYGLKVSKQVNFHVGWFKRLIRRVGLFLFGAD